MNKKSTISRIFTGILLCFTLSFTAFSQPFVPVSIGGFNNDVVAEAGTSSLLTTTSAMDGVTVSNKVIYTSTFATLNAFGGGGIPDNGIITDADGTYQMADYTANNALIIPRDQTGDITITTPAQFDHIRVLCLSTEGTSSINATLFFADGTSSVALTNYAINDWFSNFTNLVLSGFGRCTRATPASGADAYPSNPNMYYMDIPISCADRQKVLQRINIANVTTAGTNAPFPNAIFFAVSATSYSLNITDNITNATCNAAGAATLSITGSSAAYNVTWNTTPVQTGLTATGLAAGSYIATVTDLNSCSTDHPVTITQVNDLTLTTHVDTTVCFAASFNANTVSAATTYSWTPVTGLSNPAIANPVVSPTGASTTYTVTGTLGTCTSTASFTVTVTPQVTLTIPSTASICPGKSFTPNTTSNGTTFLWVPSTGVSDPAIANPVLSPAATTNYTLTATTGNCSTSANLNLAIAPPLVVNAGNDVTIGAGQSTQLHATAPDGTYTWTPVSGLSAGNILNPVAAPSVTTTYTLSVTNTAGCTGSDAVDVIVNGVPECGTPMNAISPNGDGINDKWLVTFGGCPRIANVKVFNRYGSTVFESENYQNDWQGTYKGKPLPDGTYYFVIIYSQPNHNNATVKGNVTIIR